MYASNMDEYTVNTVKVSKMFLGFPIFGSHISMKLQKASRLVFKPKVKALKAIFTLHY